MTLEEAIRTRHSVRQYLEKPIEAEKIQQLQDLIDECNREGGLHIQLVTNEPKAFASGIAHYSKFRGVSNYIAMIGKKGDDVNLGYYGEKVVLLAQCLGLNTCWVAMSFSKQPDQYQVLPDEKLVCVVSLGYGENQGRQHPQRKTIADVTEDKRSTGKGPTGSPVAWRLPCWHPQPSTSRSLRSFSTTTTRWRPVPDSPCSTATRPSTSASPNATLKLAPKKKTLNGYRTMAKEKINKTNACRLLDQKKIQYELIPYEVDENDLGAQHIADQLGEDIDQVFKTLVLKGDKTGHFVCVIPGNEEVDLKKTAKVTGNKSCDLIPMKELLPLTGYIRGGCSPIGMKKPFPTFIHETCELFDIIYVSAGVRGLQFKINPQDLIHAAEMTVADLCP